ncbi:MAG: 16S rRNA (cytosine(967)-C(5))-methyltransferase RsmB [Pseudomonadales bacterium]|nr:16S rRNA (cytosine(967)-C(5))-methyltransferase RsmB [Pseudomonadales bacterium]
MLSASLYIGLYQLRELSIPDHAVLNESVAASQDLKKPWAKALVNAILRNYLRRQAELDASIDLAEEHVRFSFPKWLSQELKRAWPSDLKQIVAGSNQRPPMTLRVNASHLSKEEYLQRLLESGLEAEPGKLAATAVYLGTPTAVSKIPGFDEGLVSVQDEASQLIPELLQLGPHQRVLDACAAPGGKTCGILESERSLTKMTSVDIASERITKIHDNLARLSLEAKVQCADISQLDSWWDGEPFDRILVDAPCSATGVIRRHPDIKLLRTHNEVRKLVLLQQKFLEVLWPCLQPNGLLLYTTCSLLPEENDQQIQQFLESTDSAKFEGIAADWGVECRYGRQLLTGARNGPDGFYYSLIRKV